MLRLNDSKAAERSRAGRRTASTHKRADKQTSEQESEGKARKHEDEQSKQGRGTHRSNSRPEAGNAY